MLASLALVALLVGGTQAAIVLSDQDKAGNERPAVAQVESVDRTDD